MPAEHASHVTPDAKSPQTSVNHAAMGHDMPKPTEVKVDHAAMGHNMPPTANGDGSTMDHSTMAGTDHMPGMAMAGIPNSLYYSSIVVVMLISLAVLELTRRRAHAVAGGWRFDLMSIAPLKALVKSRGVQVTVQMSLLATFLVILAAGFYGNQMPTKNIAPTVTWNIW
ncbi:MAG: hypothetical protein ABGY41_22920, partial [Candidatus Poribacteria bacterium]